MDTATHHIEGHTMYEHWLTVPLDYFGACTLLPPDQDSRMIPDRINLFAREYVRDGHAGDPRLVFFQGGPGSAGPRMAPIGTWLDTALENFRVVLIDERGTGNSHPMDAAALAAVRAPEAQAMYLSCFRQDSIVRDAEILRRELQGDQPWAALGQSFGGFTVTCYLSQAPEGLSEAYITAGLPSLTEHPDSVYELTYREVAKRNEQFFARYPGDEGTAWYVASHLADVEEHLSTGERLTPARFRQIGITLGHSYGLENLHFLLEDPVWSVGGQRRLRPQFLARVGKLLSFADNPLYGLIHESIYAQRSTGATRWSAQRVRGQFPEFVLPAPSAGASGETDLRREGHGFRFTGEHVYPWQIEQDPALAPLSEAAEILAFETRWPQLYSPEALAENTVPTAAWIYVDDVFVPYSISYATAKQIRGLKPLISNEYHHDGLRTGGPKMIEQLIGAVRG
ncbi:MAG: alpha/beta fold hydrolase [Ancrocorticia sp.]|uniref:alpha/beta fold hydrolase n=1 Tax=Ancrocorticia sp. TaxID=2593684 RepID=UPI003F90428F